MWGAGHGARGRWEARGSGGTVWVSMRSSPDKSTVTLSAPPQGAHRRTFPISLPAAALPARLVRSSLHLDPHHNLLVLVAGTKRVRLIPPLLTPCVYPMTITGGPCLATRAGWGGVGRGGAGWGGVGRGGAGWGGVGRSGAGWGRGRAWM